MSRVYQVNQRRAGFAVLGAVLLSAGLLAQTPQGTRQAGRPRPRRRAQVGARPRTRNRVAGGQS